MCEMVCDGVCVCDVVGDDVVVMDGVCVMCDDGCGMNVDDGGDDDGDGGDGDGDVWMCCVCGDDVSDDVWMGMCGCGVCEWRVDVCDDVDILCEWLVVYWVCVYVDGGGRVREVLKGVWGGCVFFYGYGWIWIEGGVKCGEVRDWIVGVGGWE